MSQTIPGRVLVVDDEFQLMDVLVEALNSQGFEAQGFLTGVGAIEALQTQEFDLLLTDLMMPEMDGITLLKACTAIDPNLVGIVMTGQGTVPTAVEAMKTGAFDYVLKPFRLETLLPVLNRAMEVRQLRLENIQLRETVAIYNLSQTIALSLDSRLVLDNTAEAALKQLDADEVSIMLLTHDKPELYIASVHGRDRQHLLGQRSSLQEGIAGWVARQTEPILLNGEVADSRFAPLHPRPEIRSAISMPMRTAGKLVGVLNVNSLQPRRPFTPGQIKALSILSSAAAAALENESLYRTLEASEMRFRALIENSADAIALLEADGTILFESPAATHILGYEAEEMVGRNAFEFLHPDDGGVCAELFGAMLKTPGSAARGVFRYRHKDDSYRWVEAIGTNLLSEASVKAMVVNYRDVTERKQAEQAVLESERQMRALVTSLDDIVFEFDEQGIYLNVWAADESLLAQPKAQMLGKTIEAVLGEENGRPFTEAVKRVLASGHPESIEYPLEVMGGQRWFVARINPILAQDGSYRTASMLIRDITERKQAEERLHESEERFRRYFELGLIGMAITSPTKGMMEVNDQICAILGYERDELLHMTWAEMTHPNDLSVDNEQFNRVMAGEIDGYSVDKRWIRKDGRVIHSTISVKCLRRTDGSVDYFIALLQDITERVQAEIALRESETRFRSLVENSSDEVSIVNADGKLMYESPTANPTLGYQPGEFVGQNLFQLIHTDDLERVQEQFARLMQDPNLHPRDQFRLQHRNGNWRWVEAVGTNLLSEPSVLGIVINYHDITERKQAEAALADSESRYRTLFEANPHPMWVYDLETLRFLAVNDAAVKHYGYSQDEFLLLTIKDVRPIEDVPALMTNLMESNQEFQASGPWRHRKKDGSLIDVEITSHSVQWKGQSARLVLANDITQRRRADEQIQRQLKQLSALHMIDIAISSSFDLNMILDVVLQETLSQLGVDATALLLFNSESQTMEYAASRGFRSDALHYTRLKLGEGYAGRALLERKTVHIPDLIESAGRLASSLLLGQESFIDYYGAPLIVKGEAKGVLEIYHRSKLQGDPEWLEFLEMLAGQAAIAIDNAQLFDSLQRSNAELEKRVAERTQELNKTNRELEHANRAKDEFLANMSHELRTPLNSILGLSETLLEQRREPLSEYQQRSLQIVQSSGSHLLALINDILDLAKIEAGKFDYHAQSLSVEEICRSSLAFVKTQATKKSITITYINEASIPRIYADPRRLKQILVNLLTNAVKFTPENGQVILQVNTDLEQEIIRFSVIDTGIGIAPEDLQQLFQPFVQVDSSLNRQQEGTGLGLALVQRLTDLHGGSVQVESEAGRGSRFIINLSCKQEEISELETPRSQAGLTASELDQTSQVLAEGSRGVVLLADDNLPNILTIGEYLESYGYEVVVARDGLEAIEKAEAINPDIILMDIQMPVLNGLDAIARLRNHARFAATPIIALTALAMPGDRERCLLAGANEYLSKPVSLKTLRQTIETILESRSGD